MTFVYGYTLLHRNWGPEHRELAQFDIVLGLVIPYIVVTSLISIAAAGALYGSDLDISGKLQPAQASANQRKPARTKRVSDQGIRNFYLKDLRKD